MTERIKNELTEDRSTDKNINMETDHEDARLIAAIIIAPDNELPGAIHTKQELYNPIEAVSTGMDEYLSSTAANAIDTDECSAMPAPIKVEPNCRELAHTLTMVEPCRNELAVFPIVIKQEPTVTPNYIPTEVNEDNVMSSMPVQIYPHEETTETSLIKKVPVDDAFPVQPILIKPEHDAGLPMDIKDNLVGVDMMISIHPERDALPVTAIKRGKCVDSANLKNTDIEPGVFSSHITLKEEQEATKPSVMDDDACGSLAMQSDRGDSMVSQSALNFNQELEDPSSLSAPLEDKQEPLGFSYKNELTCEECRKTFANKQNLRVHAMRHAGDKPHTCQQCNKSFTTNSDLKRHSRLHTGEKPYSCDECGRSFTASDRLTVHKRSHTGEKPYSCDECGRSFTKNNNLTVHKRSHSGEKPYSCDECGRSFTTHYKLTVHKRSHTGEKPYFCDECGTSFTTNGELKVHKRFHTGEKPYSCDICEKSFADRSNLRRHRRTHTGKNSV